MTVEHEGVDVSSEATTGVSGKHAALRTVIRAYDNMAVALSGGVDSTLLAKVAHDELGDRMIAVTSAGASAPRDMVEAAHEWAVSEGIRHVVIAYDELSISEFAANAPDRCYHCKKALFTAMADEVTKAGFTVLADGSNIDDEGDYRPGLRALAELGVVSPLREAGFAKSDVRALSRVLGLPTWNLPAAACLASRFAYGERITEAKLRRVEQAESYLRSLGISQLRVRVHGSKGELARIEVAPSDIAMLAADDVRTSVVDRLREIGFTYVSLDLVGFRSGAMNETL